MLSGLFGLAGSLITARAMGKIAGALGDYIDGWLRLAASLLASCFVTFFGIWGIAGGALMLARSNCWMALVSGFLAGIAAMAAVFYKLWRDGRYWDAKKNRWVNLTSGMAIAVPTEIVKLVEETNMSTTEMK